MKIKNISTLGSFFAFLTALIFYEYYIRAQDCSDFGCLKNIIEIPFIAFCAIILVPISYFIGRRTQNKISNNKKLNIILIVLIITLFFVLVETTYSEIGGIIRSWSFVKSDDKYDQETTRILDDDLKDPINYYFWHKGKLPDNLQELKNFIILTKYQAPGTLINHWENYKEKYYKKFDERKISYVKKGEMNYELCANFKTEFREGDHLVLNYSYGSESFWHHGKGNQCFQINFDIEKQCLYCGDEAIVDIATSRTGKCYQSEILKYQKENNEYPEDLNSARFKSCRGHKIKFNESSDTFYGNDFVYKKTENKYSLCTEFFSDNTIFSNKIIEYINNTVYGKNGYFELKHSKGEYCF